MFALSIRHLNKHISHAHLVRSDSRLGGQPQWADRRDGRRRKGRHSYDAHQWRESVGDHSSGYGHQRTDHDTVRYTATLWCWWRQRCRGARVQCDVLRVAQITVEGCAGVGRERKQGVPDRSGRLVSGRLDDDIGAGAPDACDSVPLGAGVFHRFSAVLLRAEEIVSVLCCLWCTYLWMQFVWTMVRFFLSQHVASAAESQHRSGDVVVLHVAQMGIPIGEIWGRLQ